MPANNRPTHSDKDGTPLYRLIVQYVEKHGKCSLKEITSGVGHCVTATSACHRYELERASPTNNKNSLSERVRLGRHIVVTRLTKRLAERGYLKRVKRGVYVRGEREQRFHYLVREQIDEEVNLTRTIFQFVKAKEVCSISDIAAEVDHMITAAQASRRHHHYLIKEQRRGRPRPFPCVHDLVRRGKRDLITDVLVDLTRRKQIRRIGKGIYAKNEVSNCA